MPPRRKPATAENIPYHYQIMFNTDQQADVCVDYMVQKLGLKKIGILQENTAFGEQAAAATKALLQKQIRTNAGQRAGVPDRRSRIFPPMSPICRKLAPTASSAGSPTFQTRR